MLAKVLISFISPFSASLFKTRHVVIQKFLSACCGRFMYVATDKNVMKITQVIIFFGTKRIQKVRATKAAKCNNLIVMEDQ